MMNRLLLVPLLAAFVAPLRASTLPASSGTDAEMARRGGRREASFNFGPLFEYRRARAREAAKSGLPPSVASLKTYWAFRPFYSQVRDEERGVVERDFLWPLATSHSMRSGLWWRALIAYGSSRDDEPSWTFNVFPVWFSGSDRNDVGYWALFPNYGTHPHFLFMDDLTFALWPVYHDYSVKGVRSHAVLWPLVSWKDAPRDSVGVWPIWGTSHMRESKHSYVLWPLVTWAAYDEDRDTSGKGHSGMFWPFFGCVCRARERQWLVLPPFFSYATTDATCRLRCPWPFVDIETGPRRDRVSVFPLYEHIAGYSYSDRGQEETTHRFGWKIVEATSLKTDNTREEVFSFFPFFTWERSWTRRRGDAAFPAEPASSYLRVWPFYSRTEGNGRVESRALELMPIRHSEGFARNWAPFWTFWSADTRPGGRTRHSLFWKIITWHVDP